ncbi:MAG TPA: TIGR03915 family putative DNA repair protein [Spirochaetia bacterium]|jgi:probable DNA metabolism protein|nr:TIGR03915 family putative DNA repair protein [Spirochaetia bacterium]
MTYLYDGSFAGLLTAIFDAELAKDRDPVFSSERSYVPDLFAEIRTVETDMEKARRVSRAIEKSAGKACEDIFFSAFLSEERNREQKIHSAIIFCLEQGEEAFAHLEREDIAAVLRLSRKTTHEAHMFKGYIRFTNLSEGFYYTAIAPTCNILPLIASHFKERFADQDWVIHDTKRASALIYLKGALEYADIETYDHTRAESSDTDPIYEELWKHYHRTIGIETRKNPRLQMHFIPKKYWSQITEMRDKNDR